MLYENMLRISRILNYDRFYTPSIEQMNNPEFDYEFVLSARITPVAENPQYFKISDVVWKKGKNRNYSQEEITRMIQHNEVRARKLMTTLKLKELLKEHPLKFSFPDGSKVIVVPKKEGDPHKVYLRWSVNRNLYVEQRSINPFDNLHKRWFNKDKSDSLIGKDWRYLLSLSETETPSNVLYQYFDGIYDEDKEWSLSLEKGTEIYNKEHEIDSKKILVPEETKLLKKRINEIITLEDRGIVPKGTPPELQKKVCIKNPITGDIKRMPKIYTGKYIRAGWSFVEKEDYKKQQQEKFKKRKEIAEDNIQEQTQKYKGPKIPNKQKGIPGSPYMKYQLIKVWPVDPETKKPIKVETLRLKMLVPQYEYVERTIEIYEKINGRKGKLLAKEKMLDSNGEPLYKKTFIGNKEEWITITRKVKPDIKVIKVLQIPSKKSILLKSTLSTQAPKSTEGMPLLSTVRRYSKLLFNDAWRSKYLEFKVGDPRNTKQ